MHAMETDLGGLTQEVQKNYVNFSFLKGFLHGEPLF